MSPQELADFLLNEVRLLCRESQHEQALDVVEQAIKHATDPTQAWLIKGQILFGLHLYDDAIKAAEEALKYGDNAEVLKLKGNVIATKGDLEGALETFNELEKLASDDPDTYFLKGSIFAEMGNMDEAIANFDRAIEVRPDMGHAWYNKAMVFFNQERYGAAINALDSAIEFMEDATEPIFIKGMAHRKLGQSKEALECFLTAAEMWEMRALVTNSQTVYLEALTAIENALEIDVTNIELWKKRGKLLYKLGHKEDARSILINTAELCVQEDNITDALATYDLLLELEPDNEEAQKAREDIGNIA
ncbi:TPR domain protein, putative component of TonB system [Methanococcoides methylutens MM1]|uniref:TPR domain protein, putative component of TonB system n=2 Tax=Methanococcoides methylutens TaxID=2226 RepID=A0A0E3WZI4_METMT|nr:TPR domain protein, putative component of TonB system [Methanococcoides methylutens MM1]